jgi:RNA polymerase sigma-70 factor (ECF subfamily)
MGALYLIFIDKQNGPVRMAKANESVDELVLRCQTGDSAAFEELFERFQPRLRYFVRRLDQAGTDVDDLLQDIWLAVFRKITTLREPTVFPVWLYKIARNRIYRHSQKKQRIVGMPQEELSISADDDEPDFEVNMADKIHKALIKIQPHHREVLTLHFLELMPYESIAEVVGCNLGTVKSRMHYAKKSLRSELEQDYE